MSNPLPLDSGGFRAPRETTPGPPLSALILSSSSHSPVVEPSSRQATSRLAEGDSPNRGGAFPKSPWQKLSGQNLGEILPEAILLEQQRERVQKSVRRERALQPASKYGSDQVFEPLPKDHHSGGDSAGTPTTPRWGLNNRPTLKPLMPSKPSISPRLPQLVLKDPGPSSKYGNASPPTALQRLKSKKFVTGLERLDFEVIDEWIARVGYKQTLEKLWDTAANKHEQYELSLKVWDIAANSWHKLGEFGALFWESCRELQIWDEAPGGEDAYKHLIGYEAVVPAMQEVFSKTDGRKKGSYNTIAIRWGANWSLDFDRDKGPDKRDRFPVDPSEKFLAGIASMARQGWDKDQVYSTVDWASKLRLNLASPGHRKGSWFMSNDIELAISTLDELLGDSVDVPQITDEKLGEHLKVGTNMYASGTGKKIGGREQTAAKKMIARKKIAKRKRKDTQKGKEKENSVDSEEEDEIEEDTDRGEEWGNSKADETGEKGWNKPVAQFLEFELDKSLRAAILGGFDHFGNSLRHLRRKGHALVAMDSDFMELMDIVAERAHELDLYFWHAGGKTSDGYLTNCFHSLTRQLLAQDPLVYALAVALRSDGVHKLISYPFPPLWLDRGDETLGLTLPLNIEAHLEASRPDRGIRMILHLDDESKGASTKVGEGFNRRRLREWRDDVVARGEEERLEETPVRMEQVYSEADIEKYGPFVPAPAKRGDLRLLLPETPFGLPVGGIVKETQRIISPHYVAVRDDLTLEREGLGTLSQVAEANKGLTALPRTPWGTPTGWENSGYRFPVAVEMNGIWAVGDAVLGLASWDSPMVQRNLRILFGDSDIARKKLINAVRRVMRTRLIRRLSIMHHAEKLVFCKSSLYECMKGYDEQLRDAVYPETPKVRQATPEESGFLPSSKRKADAAGLDEEGPPHSEFPSKKRAGLDDDAEE